MELGGGGKSPQVESAQKSPGQIGLDSKYICCNMLMNVMLSEAQAGPKLFSILTMTKTGQVFFN